MKPIDDTLPIDSYKHGKKRTTIPTIEQSSTYQKRNKVPRKTYQYDPSLDPQLQWTGKVEQGDELSVATVPIFIHEKISAEAWISKLKMSEPLSAMHQLSLFYEDTASDKHDKAIEYYQHQENWRNRMITGDSLVVMNSLLEKEAMGGKIQTIYIDPPYGIKFGSNWQVSTRSKNVNDGKDADMTRQPEQVKAFRDTWELGIHSYLSYLRDRLLLARELLTDSGSCFVQINDANVHLIRCLMDEVFGAENFVGMIKFVTTSGFRSNKLSRSGDNIIWYAKDIWHLKFNRIYKEKNEDTSGYNRLETSDGERRTLFQEEVKNPKLLPKSSRLYSSGSLFSSGINKESSFPFIFKGKTFFPSDGHWKTSLNGLEKLAKLNRLEIIGNNLRYVRYLEDFAFVEMNNIWTDTQTFSQKTYVVQTSTEVIKRCILMTSDPGDIVFDPTCGSGTTAFVAEQWGRRWITCDTSRVAIALARTRLMTAKFPYYKLIDEKTKDPAHGFHYKKVPHVTLGSLANDEPAGEEILYDQPLEDKNIIRVSGAFTIEALAPQRFTTNQEMVALENFVNVIINNMKSHGVQQGDKKDRIKFQYLELLPTGNALQAKGETADGVSVAIAVGGQFSSIDSHFILSAVHDAKQFTKLLVVAGMAFDSSAYGVKADIPIVLAKINPDLSMGKFLKKTTSGNLFVSIGRPDIAWREDKGKIIVELRGLDVYDPTINEMRHSGNGDIDHDIACWFIDTDYDGESFFIRHAYFLGEDNKPYEKLQKALKADIDKTMWESLNSTISQPIEKPKNGKIAIKVINHYGDEATMVIDV